MSDCHSLFFPFLDITYVGVVPVSLYTTALLPSLSMPHVWQWPSHCHWEAKSQNVAVLGLPFLAQQEAVRHVWMDKQLPSELFLPSIMHFGVT